MKKGGERMEKTRYSKLKTRASRKEVETYQGIWNHLPCKFQRNFRGHRLTDEECAGLCRGEKIEVHNLQNFSGLRYALACQLAHKENLFGEKVIGIEVLDTVSNQPNHQYGDPLSSLNPYQVVIPLDKDFCDELVLDDHDLDGIDTEDESAMYPMKNPMKNEYRDQIHQENEEVKMKLKTMVLTKLTSVSVNEVSDKVHEVDEVDEVDEVRTEDTLVEDEIPVDVSIEHLSYNADTDSF